MANRISSLDFLDPTFKSKLLKVLEDLADAQIPLEIFESIRSPTRQNELYGQGRDPAAVGFGRTVTNATAYGSAHQHGLAADLVFKVDGKWSWDEPKAGYWDDYQAIATKHGLRVLNFERPHIELPVGKRYGNLPKGPENTDLWLAWLKTRNTPKAS